jgi:hypothetical protein
MFMKFIRYCCITCAYRFHCIIIQVIFNAGSENIFDKIICENFRIIHITSSYHILLGRAVVKRDVGLQRREGEARLYCAS